MKKINFIIVGLFIVSLAFAVYAATLIEEVRTISCVDSDGGLNYFVKGNATGRLLDGTPFFQSDICVDNLQSVREYTCDNKNGTITRQLWYQNCTDLNSTLNCVNGKCI